jgi:hypothetical protein
VFSLWLGCVCSCVWADKNKAEENYFLLVSVEQMSMTFPLWLCAVWEPVCDVAVAVAGRK